MSTMPPNQGSPFPTTSPSHESTGDGQPKSSTTAPGTGEKKKNLLTAASALTRLGSSSEGGDQSRDSDTNDVQPGREDDASGAAAGEEPSESKPEEEDNIPMSFPQRLMEILSNEEHQDIISWLPHGRGFMIYHKKRFAEEVLPKYFKKTKFTSFTRKLNRWNFTRVTRGPETGAYYHECFQRGNLRLCMQMCCQSAKSQKSQQQQQQLPRNVMASPNMAARLNMNNAMSRLQITQQMPMSLNASATNTGIDPNINILMLQQQLEQQRQELLRQQQQQQNQQQPQYAGFAGLSQPQAFPNQQQGMLPSMPPSAPPIGAPAPAPFGAPVAATPAPTPALGSPDQNNVYSRGVVNAAIHALERSNQTGYLTMLLAQEKAQAQMASLGGGTESISRADMQRHQANIMLAQQQQLDLLAKQRMLQAAANTAQQQQQQQQQQGQKPSSPNGPEKRAKAA